MAKRILGMKKRSIGRLGGGKAAIAALLVSMGVGMTEAQAQDSAGGGSATSTDAVNGSQLYATNKK